jgi:glycosyltransferase involved in cell wall biosynthesis
MPALDKPLRFARVAPLHESVPPRPYGGTQRVVSYLTEELVRQGHHVTLVASGDSTTAADLVPGCDRALRLDLHRPATRALHAVMIEEVLKRAAFDIIHCHTDSLHVSLARRCTVPVLTTLHSSMVLVRLDSVQRELSELPLVSISDAQRKPLRRASWAATIHHGLAASLYVPTCEPERYLAFLGRISPKTGVDHAIAQRSNVPLRIAAKVDAADRECFATYIEPLLSRPYLHFVGEINQHDKASLLGGALALLFPIEWPEPLGLSMIEAMACGTPVIAFPRGSVSEIVDPGETGHIVESVDEAVEAVQKARQLDRRRCCALLERRFSVERMAQCYCEVYLRIGVANRTRGRRVS